MQALSPEIIDQSTHPDFMPVSETRFRDLTDRVNNIAESVATLQGARGTPEKQSHPALIAILSIVGTGILAFWGWMGIEVVHQGKQIAVIIEQISPAKGLQDISKLDQASFAKALPALQRITTQPIPPEPVPQPIIKAVAKKLQEADDRAPEYWPAVFQFINFASQNAVPTAPPEIPRVSLAQMTVTGIVSNQTIEFDDGIVLKNIRFVNCRIIFTEVPVGLENVQFINSVFYLPVALAPTDYIKNAARSLLSSNLESVTLTVPIPRKEKHS